MKVKVMRIEGDYGVIPDYVVQSRLQEWLDDNPNAKIEHITQTAWVIPGTDDEGYAQLLVTIFYRD